MSEQFFSDGFTRCRRRRSWKKQALLILLAALVAWLLSGCEMQSEPPAWLSGVVLCLVVFGMMSVVPFVVWQLRRRNVEAQVRWGAVGKAEEEDPLALPYMGMKREDLLRILASMIVECCMAEELVQKSMGPAADARLRQAMNCLQGLKVCLGRLADCAARSGEPDAAKLEQAGSLSHEGRVQS